MNILVLGAAGMLGNAMVRILSMGTGNHRIWAAIRAGTLKTSSLQASGVDVVGDIDVLDIGALIRLFERATPDCVINCVGLIKHKAAANDPLSALPINAMLPHRLHSLCRVVKARLIHLSTDCVFSGARGNYREDDIPDAIDVYGVSKRLGEVIAPDAVTIRTSIIGHELSSNNGLLEWFLSQSQAVKGYRKAIFSGLPTVELARVIRDYVVPNENLAGLFHIGGPPISKMDLLGLIAVEYSKKITIEPDDSVRIDRSLDGSKFRAATGYSSPPWEELVSTMRAERLSKFTK